VKLRTKGRSIRLRLTRGEVDALGRGERVAETVPFSPTARFVYAVECGGGSIVASLVGSALVVRVPSDAARTWSTSEQVGLSADQPIAGEEPLKILIEKDFACLTVREGEDDGDAFPNPNQTC
jgi:hypothetical protein